MRISDWSSDVCSSDLNEHGVKLFTPPADYPPAFLKAANTVLKTHEEEDPFFKEVVASLREFDDTAVPYRVETLKQSLLMGEAGLAVTKQPQLGLHDPPGEQEGGCQSTPQMHHPTHAQEKKREHAS